MKKMILFSIPMSICNFRCSYCYLSQREDSFQGIQPVMKYSPKQLKEACSRKRVGGIAYGNFTATGETLLVKDIDNYVRAFISEGHFCEVVTNLTVTSVIDKFLLWTREELSHVSFKASFHYLELRKKGLLNIFANNAKRIWDAGGSVSIEVTPADEYIPYIDEIKDFSMREFGALPHLTIARDDRTTNIGYLTKLSDSDYSKVWGQFDSDFWKFKRKLFGVKREEFCNAGGWSIYVNLATGEARQCYCGKILGNFFDDIDRAIPNLPIGVCELPHCYNGHAHLSCGLIPSVAQKNNVHYGDLRNRIREDGTMWLQENLLYEFNKYTFDENDELSIVNKNIIIIGKIITNKLRSTKKQLKRIIKGTL